MIKIPISERQKEEIEKIYWEWICIYHLEELLVVIKNDNVMEKIIKNEGEDLTSALKNFFLSNYIELEKIKSKIDELRNQKACINKYTKEYLKARYSNYRNTQAAKIINLLGVTVCPYCNQNHINIVYGKDGKLRFWGDLDHFYDKSTYPELSICLYNMIPVCKVCNQLKSAQKKTIISPFNCEIKSNIQFKTEFDDKFDLDYLRGNSQNFNITIDESKLTEVDREEIELFDLKNRYKQLKHNAQEIIIKSRAYTELYQRQLQDEFALSEDELKAFIFGYDDNHLNRVLSKFDMDMMNEFMDFDEI